MRLTDKNAIADNDIQQWEQTGIQPHLPRIRPPRRDFRRPESELAIAQLAAQGIRIADRFYRGQMHTLLPRKYHGGEGQGPGSLQPIFFRCLPPVRGQFMAAFNYPVSRQKAMTFLFQGTLQAGGKGADAGDNRHRYHQRSYQYPQLTTTPFTNQHPDRR